MKNHKDKPMNLTWGGAFKSISDQGILEGNAIVFGSEKQPDISSFRDFFTEKTFVHPEEEFVTPLYLEHGHQYRKPIGKASMFKTQTGWEAIAELDMTNEIVKSKFEDIKKGNWGFSTGAVGHVVDREKKSNGTHMITQWSVGELSITKTPAEPRALIHEVKSLDEYYNPILEEESEDEMEGDLTNEMLMKIIEMLVAEITKKNIEDIVIPEINQLKEMISELKNLPLPNGSTDEELTVLKSSNEELKSKLDELQSSFDEKEALLSEKVALLSEMEAELETLKSQDLVNLETTIKTNETEIESLKEQLNSQRETNRVLARSIQNK